MTACLPMPNRPRSPSINTTAPRLGISQSRTPEPLSDSQRSSAGDTSNRGPVPRSFSRPGKSQPWLCQQCSCTCLPSGEPCRTGTNQGHGSSPLSHCCTLLHCTPFSSGHCVTVFPPNTRCGSSLPSAVVGGLRRDTPVE